MKDMYAKRFTHSRAGNVMNLLFLMLVAAFMLMPMVYTVSSAFKPFNELFLFPPTFFVKHPTVQNFRMLSSVFRDSWVPMSRYIFNSVFITVVGTAGHVILASLAAYRISKYTFPGKDLLFNLVVLSLMFSPAVTSIPNYVILCKLGLINTQWAIIIPTFGSSLGLFLMKQFIDSMIPDSLLEAARIDGAREFRIFTSVVLPLVKPAWLTLIIFSFQSLWSNNGGAFLFDEELKTLPYALSTVVSAGISRTGVAAVIALIMLLPPIAVFILTQSNIMETMATSGIKD